MGWGGQVCCALLGGIMEDDRQMMDLDLDRQLILSHEKSNCVS